jgi:hypothetical protein
MIPPTYNPNVPQGPSSSIGQGQQDFLLNFQTLYDAFVKDHIALDAAADKGNHTVIELLQQTEQFQTNAGEISIYSKNISEQTDQVFLRYPGNQDEFRFTNYQIYPLEPLPFQTSYITFLPGNILVYFGVFVPNLAPPEVSALVLLPYVAKNIISVNLTPLGFSTGGILNVKYPPNIDTVSAIPGIITQINVKSSFGIQIAPRCYYIVVVNI